MTALHEIAKGVRIAPNSIAFKIVKDLMNGENKTGRLLWRDNVAIIRPCYTLGAGKWTSVQDHSLNVKILLKSIGITFTCGNDAKLGGKTGQFIKVEL